MNDKTLITSHNVKILDRNFIELSGIKKIDSFNDEEFLLESIIGNIDIKGENLEIIKLDTNDGNVKIKGKINALNYLEEKSKLKEESFVSKLFK